MINDAQITPRCPIRTTLEMLGGKWRLLLLHQISGGVNRYGALKRAVPEISEKMLTQELKHLVDSGLLHRENMGEVPPKVIYTLTEMGHKAHELIEPITTFGLHYMERQKD